MTGSTTTGVYVRTWGSHDSTEPDTGMSHFIDASIYGKNVGHASVEIVLPDTPENRQMVEKHLNNTTIPFERKKIETKKVEFDKETNKPTLTNENAFEENIISIYFSWWPSENESGYELMTLQQDLTLEHSGVHMEYAKEWQDYLQPQARATSGIRSQIITLPPRQTLHTSGAADSECDALLAHHQFSNIQEDLTAINLLLNKFSKRKDQSLLISSLSKTENLLMQRFFTPIRLSENLADNGNLDINTIIKSAEIIQATILGSHQKYFLELMENMIALTEVRDHDEYKLTADEKTLLSRIDDLEDLNEIFQEIESYDDLRQYQISQTNKIIQTIPLLSEHYNDEGLTQNNFLQMKDVIKRETDLSNEESMVSRAKSTIIKQKMHKLHNAIDTISIYKKLALQITTYLTEKEKDTNPIDIAKSRAELLQTLSSIEYLDNMYNTPKGNLSDKLIEALQLKVQERLQPTGTLTNQVNTSMEQYGSEMYQILSKQNLDPLLEKFATIGLPPSHTTRLPIQNEALDGLEPEQMLIQMATYFQNNKKFNLTNNNCSVTSGEVLAAGTGGKKAWVFEQKALMNSVATPQMVYNNSRLYSQQVEPEPNVDNTWKKYFMNWAVDSAAVVSDPEASYASRGYNLSSAITGATLAGIFVMPTLLSTNPTPAQPNNQRKAPLVFSAYGNAPSSGHDTIQAAIPELTQRWLKDNDYPKLKKIRDSYVAAEKSCTKLDIELMSIIEYASDIRDDINGEYPASRENGLALCQTQLDAILEKVTDEQKKPAPLISALKDQIDNSERLSALVEPAQKRIESLSESITQHAKTVQESIYDAHQEEGLQHKKTPFSPK